MDIRLRLSDMHSGDPLPEFSVQDLRAAVAMHAGGTGNHPQIERSGRARPYGNPDLR